MTLADLERTLREVLNTGQLGEPVALRVFATRPEIGNAPANLTGLCLPLIRLIAPETQGRVLARQHQNKNQCSVHWTSSQGRTVFLTGVSTMQASFQVLLVGNHGITRLTGEPLWEEPRQPGQSQLWEKEITESLNLGTSIAVGIS